MANPQGILIVGFSPCHLPGGRWLILNGSRVRLVECNLFRFCLRRRYAPSFSHLTGRSFE